MRVVQESGQPIRRVAADLGIRHGGLLLWVRKAEADRTPTGWRVLPTGIEQELKALRKRIAELERANQILLEASVLFATALDQGRPTVSPTQTLFAHHHRVVLRPSTLVGSSIARW